MKRVRGQWQKVTVKNDAGTIEMKTKQRNWISDNIHENSVLNDGVVLNMKENYFKSLKNIELVLRNDS